MSLMMYDTVSFMPGLAVIVTEWFPAGLTSLVSTRGRVPVEKYIRVLNINCGIWTLHVHKFIGAILCVFDVWR